MRKSMTTTRRIWRRLFAVVGTLALVLAGYAVCPVGGRAEGSRLDRLHIPDVPDFSNGRWQATRSDGQLARSILQGRGAVMPPFRGSLSLEEAYGVARYLRTLVPGTEIARPDVGKQAVQPLVVPAKSGQ
jgi:hypothetical protein